MNTDVLPDSRLRSPKFTKLAQWLVDGHYVTIELEPVYCANCGTPHGYVPIANTSFAFWLCDKCFTTWGIPAGTMVSSDEIYWRRVRDAMMNKYGHVLSKDELQQLAKDGYGQLATLIKESPNKER